MRTSLFRKTFIYIILINIFCYLMLSGMLFFSMSNYYVKDDLKELQSDAQTISRMAGKTVARRMDGSFSFDANTLLLIVAAMPNATQDVFITDGEGNCLVCADGFGTERSCIHQRQISDKIMKTVQGGVYNGVGTLENIYAEKQYIVGVPITYGEASPEQMIGAVFVASTAKNFSRMRKDIVQMCMIAFGFVTVLSFLGIGMITYHTTLPLAEMNAAAKEFGKGNFSRRVSVRSKDEVGQLAESLNNMASSLAVSENQNRSFIANVSHELKTPMTTISGFVDGILDGTIPPEKERQYLKVVSEETKRLSRLVRSMLDLSRIDRGELKLNCIVFSLKDTLLNVLFSFEGAIGGKKVDIEGLEEMEDIFVFGDIDLLHQVVYNLVDNAVKFVNEGGKIYASLTKDGNFVRLVIGNTGPGIAPTELPLIFDRFYKTDKSRSFDKKGVGLGLYLVRMVVQLHGGTITANSIENEFTEFTVVLPGRAMEEENK